VLLGIKQFDLKMAGSDTNKTSLKIASDILKQNGLKADLRHQTEPSFIFEGVVSEDDQFDFSICNPPFFETEEDRKERRNSVCPIDTQEETTPGGEVGFLTRMAQESYRYKSQIKWFTSLVGKRSTFEFMKTYLGQMMDTDGGLVYTGKKLEGLGKTSRWVIAWKFN